MRKEKYQAISSGYRSDYADFNRSPKNQSCRTVYRKRLYATKFAAIFHPINGMKGSTPAALVSVAHICRLLRQCILTVSKAMHLLFVGLQKPMQKW
ncbi:unnamed protein product [Oppiella nova]|uniref:Uncharacterized protein n=1 Tax=Oppiella nova TaxID=334625 RepID=A0A7R9LBR1_9ACAR|nr:unnamed protein product [Oppiella nova]CAG2161923.1 unnamed protein product [Oppiella nova]